MRKRTYKEWAAIYFNEDFIFDLDDGLADELGRYYTRSFQLEQQVIEHAYRKWRGILSVVRHPHWWDCVVKENDWGWPIYSLKWENDDEFIKIDGSTCSLCVVYHDSHKLKLPGICVLCPLLRYKKYKGVLSKGTCDTEGCEKEFAPFTKTGVTTADVKKMASFLREVLKEYRELGKPFPTYETEVKESVTDEDC